MEIQIEQLGKHSIITIEGTKLTNVKDYKIISSASGETELTITLGLTTDLLSTALIEPRQQNQQAATGMFGSKN